MTNPINPYRSSKPVFAPRQVQALPLNSLRTSLVTRQPKVAGEAAAQARSIMAGERPVPMMLPQSMQFGHWNRNEGGESQGNLPPWTQSPMGLIRALGQSGTARAPRVTTAAPKAPIMQVAHQIAANQFPNPQIPMLETPIRRRWPGHSTPVTSAPPQAFAEAHQAMGQTKRQQLVDERSRVTNEVARKIQSMRAIFGG